MEVHGLKMITGNERGEIVRFTLKCYLVLKKGKNKINIVAMLCLMASSFK